MRVFQLSVGSLLALTLLASVPGCGAMFNSTNFSFGRTPGAPGSELADAVTEAGFHVARLGESQLHEFFESYPRGGATRESGAFRIEL